MTQCSYRLILGAVIIAILSSRPRSHRHTKQCRNTWFEAVHQSQMDAYSEMCLKIHIAIFLSLIWTGRLQGLAMPPGQVNLALCGGVLISAPMCMRPYCQPCVMHVFVFLTHPPFFLFLLLFLVFLLCNLNFIIWLVWLCVPSRIGKSVHVWHLLMT